MSQILLIQIGSMVPNHSTTDNYRHGGRTQQAKAARLLARLAAMVTALSK